MAVHSGIAATAWQGKAWLGVVITQSEWEESTDWARVTGWRPSPLGGSVRVVQCPSPPGGGSFSVQSPPGGAQSGSCTVQSPPGGTSQGRTVFKSSPGFVLRTVAQTASIFDVDAVFKAPRGGPFRVVLYSNPPPGLFYAP